MKKIKILFITILVIFFVIIIFGGYAKQYSEVFDYKKNNKINNTNIYLNIFGTNRIIHVPFLVFLSNETKPFYLQIIFGSDKKYNNIKIDNIELTNLTNKTNLLSPIKERTINFKLVDHDYYEVGNFQSELQLPLIDAYEFKEGQQLLLTIEATIETETDKFDISISNKVTTRIISWNSTYREFSAGI